MRDLEVSTWSGVYKSLALLLSFGEIFICRCIGWIIQGEKTTPSIYLKPIFFSRGEPYFTLLDLLTLEGCRKEPQDQSVICVLQNEHHSSWNKAPRKFLNVEKETGLQLKDQTLKREQSFDTNAQSLSCTVKGSIPNALLNFLKRPVEFHRNTFIPIANELTGRNV